MTTVHVLLAEQTTFRKRNLQFLAFRVHAGEVGVIVRDGAARFANRGVLFKVARRDGLLPRRSILSLLLLWPVACATSSGEVPCHIEG